MEITNWTFVQPNTVIIYEVYVPHSILPHLGHTIQTATLLWKINKLKGEMKCKKTLIYLQIPINNYKVV